MQNQEKVLITAGYGPKQTKIIIMIIITTTTTMVNKIKSASLQIDSVAWEMGGGGYLKQCSRGLGPLSEVTQPKRKDGSMQGPGMW